jgi:hypothetical protein
LLPTYTIFFPLTSHVHVVVISGRRSLFARRWQRVIERRRVEILFFFLRSLGFFCATELGHGKHARTHTHTHTTHIHMHTHVHTRQKQILFKVLVKVLSSSHTQTMATTRTPTPTPYTEPRNIFL